MNAPEQKQHQPDVRRRKGQTLAEFALTLPILLILVFGIIEFGRVFQAWVTLQNSARAAARYASTGGWDEVRLPLNDSGEDDPDSVVPCVGGNTAGGNEDVGSSRVDLQACKLEYSIVSPK